MDERTVVISGSRTVDEDNIDLLEEAVEASPWNIESIDRVLVGDADGVDQVAQDWADKHGLSWEEFEADWAEHGNAAGAIRNRKMLKAAKAESRCSLVAVWDGSSPGTKNAFETAANLGISAYVHPVPGAEFEPFTIEGNASLFSFAE